VVLCGKPSPGAGRDIMIYREEIDAMAKNGFHRGIVYTIRKKGVKNEKTK
jgi:hypothetical protein